MKRHSRAGMTHGAGGMWFWKYLRHRDIHVKHKSSFHCGIWKKMPKTIRNSRKAKIDDDSSWHSSGPVSTCEPVGAHLKYGGFLKWGYPQSSSISFWDFPWNKPSILGYHHLSMRKNPSGVICSRYEALTGNISITEVSVWGCSSPSLKLMNIGHHGHLSLGSLPPQFCATHDNFGYGNGWNPNTFGSFQQGKQLLWDLR